MGLSDYENHFLNDQKKSTVLFAKSFKELGDRLGNATSIDLTTDQINEKKEPD
jgi:hypothetical protein